MDPIADERFTRIYEAHYLEVLAYCARRVSRSEAEDVTNDTFMVLWRRIDSFDAEFPLPWLYRTAYGSIRNRWRSTRRSGALVSRLSGMAREPSEAVDVVVVRRERDRAVVDIVSKMRSGDQEVLRLSIWEELTAPDIAVVLECSVSAAEQRLHRAKKRLASKLSPSLSLSEPSPESLENGGRP
jgi:RNA polymerase sigma-70 factor (ECF subfamily)